MKELEHRVSDLGVERTFYQDDEGRLIVKRTHDHSKYDEIFKRNEIAKTDVKFAPNVRKIAEIPIDLYDHWVSEANTMGYYDPETISAIISFHLSNPDNKRFLSVPDNYRINKNGL